MLLLLLPLFPPSDAFTFGHITIIASPTNLMTSPPNLYRFFTQASMYRLMQNASSSLPLMPIAAHASDTFVNPEISAKRQTVSISCTYGKFSAYFWCLSNYSFKFLILNLVSSLSLSLFNFAS